MANKYTDECRREAVDYVLNSEGKSIRECARELGLNDKTLSSWVATFKREGRTGSGMTDEDGELARLRMENERLRMEKPWELPARRHPHPDRPGVRIPGGARAGR